MRAKTIIVSAIVGLTVLLLVYFILTSKGNRYQWYQSYDPDSNQPYGTLFMKLMLGSYFTGDLTVNKKEPIHKVLENEKYKQNTNYVLIGQNVYFDTLDVEALRVFIANGNDVFVATMEVPSNLVNAVFTNYCEQEFRYDYNLDTAVYANFYDSTLSAPADYEFKYRIGDKDFPTAWEALEPDVLCDTTGALKAIGYQQGDLTNFVSIAYGEGHLYLHSSPLMFTNYYMIKKDKMEYASAVFSHLSGENTIWDEVSKVPYSNQDDPYSSPLYYILQQPALKYAWWMLLIGAFLYVIFASKRTQRIIPVLETKSNTSLEFLNVISSLHYQNPNHLDMARKKMKYFLYFIRAKYGINTQSLTEEQAKRLADKAKVDIADIQAIIDRYKVIENYSISNDEPERLVGLYEAIEKFYKNCK